MTLWVPKPPSPQVPKSPSPDWTSFPPVFMMGLGTLQKSSNLGEQGKFLLINQISYKADLDYQLPPIEDTQIPIYEQLLPTT